MSKPSYPLKSMTAYGRAAASFAYGSFTVEIQSVNRRYLEVNVSLPRLLTRFEAPIRKKVAERVGRGMVNVFIGWRSEAKNPVSVTPNLSLARGVKKAWEQIAYDLGLESRIDLSLFVNEKDLIIFEEELLEEEAYWSALEKALEEALDQLIAMKDKEGSSLTKDLQERINALEKVVADIEENAPEGVEKYRQKLTDRLEELFTGSPENEERILREIALFAERIDITEEIVRFKSHVQQFRQLLEKPLSEPTETRGKTLDFLIQELNREINTIGSKGSDLAITQRVVVVKGELEKMREQVQNIE